MKKHLLITSVAVTLFTAPTAFAANVGGYIGASIGGSKVKDAPSGSEYDAQLLAEAPSITATSSVDDTDNGWKIYGGYKFNQNMAVEGSYADFGEMTIDSNVTSPFQGTLDTTWEAQTLAVAGVGILPLAYSMELFGKIGVHYWDVDYQRTASAGGGVGSASESENGTDLLFGVGAGYTLNNNFALRAEWERYGNIGDDNTTGEFDVDMWSVGVMYTF